MIKKILFALSGMLLLSAFTNPQSLGSPNLNELSTKSLSDLLPAEIYTITEPELDCLAKNIYHEARNDMMAGQFAVADVVLNRVHDKRYPNDICAVIYEGPVQESWRTKKTPDPNDAELVPIKNKCQFSWYCDGKTDIPWEGEKWHTAKKLAAWYFLNRERIPDITDGSTHYHGNYIKYPYWSRHYARTVSIDNHIFYRNY